MFYPLLQTVFQANSGGVRHRNPERTILQFGRKVAELRHLREWTQEQLAERIGVASQRVQQIERGKANVTLYTLVRLANYLQVPAWRLLLPADAPAQVARPGRPVGSGRKLREHDYAKTIYRGLYYKDGPWFAKIQHEGVPGVLGSFATEKQAARAYDEAAKRLHKKHARLNFPPDAKKWRSYAAATPDNFRPSSSREPGTS